MATRSDKNREDKYLEPRVAGWNKTRPVLICSLAEFNCDEPHYARGVCQGHYHQWLAGQEFGVMVTKREYPPCKFPGCEKLSHTKREGLCKGHVSQFYRQDELRPVNHHYQGMTDAGRICKDCKIEKPLDEFYDRNQKKILNGEPSKSTKCKDCYKLDIAYWQGRRMTKADGTDPLDYKNNPAEQDARLEKLKARAREYEANRRKKRNGNK